MMIKGLIVIYQWIWFKHDDLEIFDDIWRCTIFFSQPCEFKVLLRWYSSSTMAQKDAFRDLGVGR